MDFTISFNQPLCLSMGLDPIDSMIASSLRLIFASTSLKQYIIEDACYKQVRPELILKALPILNIKKRALQNRIASLEEKGIIERWEGNQGARMSLYKAGVNFDKLFQQVQEDAQECKQMHSTNANKCTRRMQENALYQDTSNQDTKTNNICPFSIFFDTFKEKVGISAYWKGKKQKAKVKRVWDSLSFEKQKLALEGIDNYLKAYEARRATHKDLIKVNVHTYLDGGRWEDELPTVAKNASVQNSAKAPSMKRKMPQNDFPLLDSLIK